MYILNGFISIEAFILNAAATDSPIGELSTQAMTYSTDIGIYNNVTHPQYTLHSFTSEIQEGAVINVPNSIRDRTLDITDWIYQNQIADGAPITRTEFLLTLTQQFVNGLSGIDCGELVQATPGIWFPEWVSFGVLGLDNSSPAVVNKITVWYADASFRAQYGGYKITVIPPLAILNQFFGGRTAVANALAQVTATDTMLRVQQAKAGHPESFISAERYHYVNQSNPLDRIPTDWIILGYGRAGDDEDAIRQAIRDYNSANSNHTENEWRAIFPDIYKVTEFIVYPRWKNYAIVDRVQQAGVYSSITNLDQELGYLQVRLPDTPNVHLCANATIIPTNYKSLALLMVGGIDNRDQLTRIDKVFPDLINVPTNDVMFSMQGPKTQAWVLAMENALITAEKATSYSELPSGMRKVLRSGILYITFKLDNITYLVSTKATTPAYAEPPPNQGGPVVNP